MTVGYAVIAMTFVAMFSLVFGVNYLLQDRRSQEARQADLRAATAVRQKERAELRQTVMHRAQAAVNRAEPVQIGEFAEAALQDARQSQSVGERLQAMVDQSGLETTVPQVLTLAFGGGAMAGVLTYLVGGNPLGAGCVAAVFVAAPFMFVEFKRRKRTDALREQIPDAFDLMSRVVRAGQTVNQAMQTVSEEFQPPIAYEFGYCYEQQNLGIDPDSALTDLGKRTGLLEMQIFALSLIIHRQSGGNIAELFDSLASTVRERFKLRGKISALTAEGRFQGLILLLLPPLVWCGILVGNRSYALSLFDYPNVLIGTVVMMTLGALWIRKIVNFDF